MELPLQIQEELLSEVGDFLKLVKRETLKEGFAEAQHNTTNTNIQPQGQRKENKVEGGSGKTKERVAGNLVHVTTCSALSFSTF